MRNTAQACVVLRDKGHWDKHTWNPAKSKEPCLFGGLGSWPWASRPYPWQACPASSSPSIYFICCTLYTILPKSRIQLMSACPNIDCCCQPTLAHSSLFDPALIQRVSMWLYCYYWTWQHDINIYMQYAIINLRAHPVTLCQGQKQKYHETPCLECNIQQTVSGVGTWRNYALNQAISS